MVPPPPVVPHEGAAIVLSEELLVHVLLPQLTRTLTHLVKCTLPEGTVETCGLIHYTAIYGSTDQVCLSEVEQLLLYLLVQMRPLGCFQCSSRAK
jgi:hypothetical protein